ncbi:recombination mediator RecR [Candidatus Magnetominusculus dajiuhuensis]|uniref:recombination mediator RecR n=1 Tax=Candidatus Magnetominusculus dajiuhuensis TaxID=3137712 RepID=UPI003B435F9B
MAEVYGIIDTLINELCRLPGIGRRTAQKLAFFILNMPKDDALSIANAIVSVKERAGFCNACFNVTESELCPICSDPTRDNTKICVVEEPGNIVVIERSRSFGGLYHVLLGALSPVDGITPDKLKINELLLRIKDNPIEEVILATNPNTKGEMTAQYIAGLLRPLNITVSRIAYGLPMGGEIEFADEVTLGKSIEGRRRL